MQGEASGLASLLQKQHAAQNTREFVRGDMGSVPFAPGALRPSPNFIMC